MSRIIAVLNQKGGVGKTTTAINLGAYLAKSGKKTLIVDFDPQGNATSGLGISKEVIGVSSYDVLFNHSEIINAIYETTVHNLSLMPANSVLATADLQLVDAEEREFALHKAIVNLEYDFILIDCPPSLGLLTINALSAANELLIPVQAEYYALEGLGQLLNVMQRVRQGLNKNLDLLGVVVTMYDGRNSLSEQVYGELEKHFGEKLFKSIIPRNVRLAEAPSYGRTIQEHDKWSKGARAYKQLAKEVIKKW